MINDRRRRNGPDGGSESKGPAKQPTGWTYAAILVAFLVGRWSVEDPAPPASQPPAPVPAAAFVSPAATLVIDDVDTIQPKQQDEVIDPVAPPPEDSSDEPEPEAEHVYYHNCSAARAAGAAPIRRGEPGYAGHLDRDDDGIACE